MSKYVFNNIIYSVCANIVNPPKPYKYDQIQDFFILLWLEI